MLNSAEHEILNAHKFKKTSRNSAFIGSDKPRMLFLLLIDVKMQTIVGISTFMSRKNFILRCENEKKFYNLGTWYQHKYSLPKSVKLI